MNPMIRSLGLLFLVSRSWAVPDQGTQPSLPLDSIVHRVEGAQKIPHSQGIVEQTVVTAAGDERSFVVRSISGDSGKKSLTVYLEPARVAGEKILSLDEGDDLWTFSPKTGRVRHLATHMKKAKVMGSDFSYEDMAGGNLKKKYQIRLRGQEKRGKVLCWVLDMIPTAHGPSYKKVVLWVDPSNWIPVFSEYHDERGLLKTLEVSEVRVVEGIPTPWSMVMENRREGGRTWIRTRELGYGNPPPAWMFTQEGLKR